MLGTESALPDPPSASVLPRAAAPAADPAFAFLSPPEAAGEVGRLAGYQVLGKLGEGSQGFVFLARDPALLRLVALKVIKPEAAGSQRARERFLREARITAALRSEHVITVYHVGEAGGLAFQAMEYLKGRTLRDWLAGRGGRVPLAEALRVAPGIFQGLAAVHAKGLVHRDVKPSNLWLEKGGGRVKILDFGLTRQESSGGRPAERCSVVGTPAYMSPEQARGEPADARADLFSAGVVLYRMLAGRSPFQRGEKDATLRAVAAEDPPPLSEVVTGLPDRMVGLVRRLLEKNPVRRPRTAYMVLDTLVGIHHSLRSLYPSRPVTARMAPAGGASSDPGDD